MNTYPPEWDTMEEEQPVIEAEYPPPSRRQAPPPRSRQAPPGRGGGKGLSVLALIVSVLALILAGAGGAPRRRCLGGGAGHLPLWRPGADPPGGDAPQPL